MSIRLKLLASITFLGGLLIAILIVNAINHATTYMEDLKAVEINEAADLLVASAGSWAVERGTSAGVLGNPSKVSDKQIQTIKNKRIEADESFKKALEIIESHGSGLLAADLVAVRKDHNEIVKLRNKIDLAIGSRDDKDFMELRKTSFKAFTKLIVDAQKLRVHEEEQLGNNVPLHVALAFTIRHNLWITSEYSGRERGMIAGMVGAGEQFPPDMLRTLGNFRGHVETGWDNAFQLKDELSSDFNAELKKVQKVYFEDFTDVRSKVISAGSSGQAYPMSSAKWFEEATKGIQSLLSAQKIAKKDIQEHIEHALSTALIWLIFDLSLLFIALVCSGFVIFVILRQVVQPLEKVRFALAELSKGNFEVFVPDIEGAGEMADMSRAVYKFKQESRAAERYREEQSTFRRETREKHQTQIRGLADQFENTVGGVIDALSSSSSQLSSTSTEVSQIANRTATKSSSVREAANEAGSEIEAVSGSVDEVNRAISEVSVTVSNTNKLTEEASSHASEASERVAALNAASAKINDIVSLISEIAEQTNLLALNATIEAARAGDAGKGFAVVANEVKSLASQTQKATVEIGSQVENMLLEITNSTKAVDLIADAVNQTNSAMTTIADAVDKQSENSQHVADASRIALEKVKSVITDIVSVTEDAASTGGATEELQASASELSRNSKLLAEETESFIGRIRVDKEEEEAA